jgi:hypothetical protein
MNEIELREYIKYFPNTQTAAAYRLGLKDKSLELAPQIEKLINQTKKERK